MRHRLMTLATLLMIVGACGGGEDDTVGEGQSGATTTSAPATDTNDSGDGTPEVTGGDDNAQAAADTGLTVTIDGVTYEFEAAECTVRDNGALGGSGNSPDWSYVENTGFTGANLQFLIQVEGSPNQEIVGFGERHFIKVHDYDRDLVWNAGDSPFLGGVTFEDSYIDSWTLEGASASGSALFIEEGVAYDQGATVVSVRGEFSLECGG